jgi:hypothetical protein
MQIGLKQAGFLSSKYLEPSQSKSARIKEVLAGGSEKTGNDKAKSK